MIFILSLVLMLVLFAKLYDKSKKIIYIKLGIYILITIFVLILILINNLLSYE